MNILNLFSISIIISGSLYPVFALDTSQTCDTINLPPRWPSSHIYITDTNGSVPYIPLTHHTTIFHDDDVWNTSTQPRSVNVTLIIQDQYTKQQVFNQTQSVQMKACSGPESVKWRFVPIQDDNYYATVSDNRGIVNMIFYSISSPLEQLRFGVDSHNVICEHDLQLVIKSEDGSPACVRPSSIERLLKQGWVNAYDNNGKYLPIILPNMIKVQNTNFTINYDITGNNKLIDANMYAQKTSLVLSMHTSSNGTLSVSIPRALLDSNLYPDTHFIVLVDKKEVNFTETVSHTARTLIIPFEYGAETMEIIAPQRI